MAVRWWHRFIILNLFAGFVFALRRQPPHVTNDFLRDGDLLLGLMADYTYDGSRGQCANLGWGAVRSFHGLNFAIDELNNDSSILPNITMGMVALDDCFRPDVALYRALKFVPPDDCTYDCCRRPTNTTSKGPARGCYDVISFITPKSSTVSIAVSQLMSQYEIPHISYMATSDKLSNKQKYPYFSRTVPPDRFQARVMMDILEHFNWTYISVLRYDTDYGRDGSNNIYSLAKERGICVAYSAEMIKASFTDDDYDSVVRGLRANKKAKLVLGFLERNGKLFDAVERAGAQGEFIFLFADGSGYLFEQEKAINSISLYFLGSQRKDTAFENYYSNILSPWSYLTQPGWYEEPAIVYGVECLWNVSKNDSASCSQYKRFNDLPYYRQTSEYQDMFDVLKIVATAVHGLVTDICPEAFLKKELLRPCITGPTLQAYIRNVSFDGYTGRIQFDNNGDGYPAYVIDQWQWRRKGDSNYSYAKVGTWTSDEGLNIDQDESFRWYNWREPGEVTETAVPESVCAKPCQPGEFYIQGELKCCWDCRQCRDNERVREDQKGCVQCPELTWPDQENFTTCEMIAPTYMLWVDPIATSLCSLASVGIVSALMIVYVFVRYRNKKAVKGSSIEQMMTILLAIFLSYITIFLLVMKPNSWGCRVAFVTFHSSCTLIFVPLLLKTTRLYRIFRAAEKCQQEIKFVSKEALICFSFVLIFILIGLFAATLTLFPVDSLHQMPIQTERFVELVCHMTKEAILIPLSYNLAVLLMCAVYGFLTRKLPDNFNESWYIFISVTTTLFVWIAFLPTYFMAFYAYHKAALLALALILNATVTSLCLFAPKIYAVYYIDESKIKVTNFNDPTNEK